MPALPRLPGGVRLGAGALVLLKAAQMAARRSAPVPGPREQRTGLGDPATDPDATTVEIDALRADLARELDRVAQRAA